MMAQVGGYRPTAPQNNFAVSATGGAGNGGQAPKYVAGMPYGEGADFMDLQSMAPMEASAGGPSASSVGAAPSQLAQQRPSFAGNAEQSDINLVPLNAPSQRPNEPITTGVDVGAGPGSEVLSSSVQPNYESALMFFQQLAASPNASPAIKSLAQKIQQVY